MDISSTLPPSANGRSDSSDRKPSAEISSDFETFLKMLTVQMQNQNPLEPIEASDFAVQLATFSNVEQQVRTNELLSQMSRFNELSEIASLVDKSVLSSAPVFVDSDDVTLIPEDEMNGDLAFMIVRDAYQNEIRRFPVDPSASEYVFSNNTNIENPLPKGHYNFSIEYYNGDSLLGEPSLRSYAKVKEAIFGSSEIVFVLDGGQRVTRESIIGVRG